ncbi:MAG: hypothetical protein JWQ71_2076 [Pedosphaera sp.]|nr:hypothetical protein [Pedosphaera sp.]
MNKFQRSWQLFKSSFSVMMTNKKLLVFPVLITTVSIFIALLFMTPIAFQKTGYGYGTAEHWSAVGNSFYSESSAGSSVSSDNYQSTRHYRGGRGALHNIKPLALAYFAVTYFVSMFFATFCNVAFYREIMNALQGEAVSIRGGIRFACTKWKIILMWTLFAGAVGFIIKALEERFGIVGQWILRLLGTAWSIACVFVVPVIITEEETTNPLVVLKKSAMTLRSTWGESLVGYAGVSFGSALVVLSSLFWLGGGIFIAVKLQSMLLGALVVASWLGGVFIFSYLMSVASQIFRCALYLYALQGALPQPYTQEMVALAWKMKKG